MDIYNDFLEMLDDAIARCGNMNKLAELFGVNPSLLTRWKRQERKPTLQQLQPLFDFLGVSWTWPGRQQNGVANQTSSMLVTTEKLQRENDILRAQLAAEKEKSAAFERLLREALAGGRRSEEETPPAIEARKAG